MMKRVLLGLYEQKALHALCDRLWPEKVRLQISCIRLDQLDKSALDDLDRRDVGSGCEGRVRAA